MTAPKAVLFDLDGTLLDTLGDIADSVNAALRAAGLQEHPLEAYKKFVGSGVPALVEKAFPAEALKVGRDAHISAVRAEYDKRVDATSKPYDGVPAMLDGLTERGIVMAILSNKPQDLTDRCVGNILGKWKFRSVRGAMPGIPLKPDPHAALKIADGLGIPAGEFLYLGDTGVDMKTASAAGMRSVGALWGFRDAEELRQAGAGALIDRPEKLLDLLS